MGQNSNAANEGDQLKHALLAEVLLRCLDWPSLTYAETHAGAGIYDAKSQTTDKAHIHKLKALVDGLENPDEATAGGEYARLLKTWWSDAEKADKYPGSVLQAAITLNRRGERLEPAQVRVTEACKEAHKRLTDAVEAFGVKSRHAGFQNEIDWLTANDSLILLVDPFGYSTVDEDINEGKITSTCICQVVRECLNKRKCVIGFWCAVSDGTGWDKRRQVDQDLSDLLTESNARWRIYGAGRANMYKMSLIGIGEGGSLVATLPATAEWGDSWLRAVIRELER